QNARRHFDIGEQDVSGGSPAGSVGLPVRQFTCHVFVAAQRVKVVLFVVVQRRFFAHALPHRVGVVIDGGVEGVVVQLDRAGAGHYQFLWCSDGLNGSAVPVQEAVQDGLDEFVDDGLPRRRLGTEVGRAQGR